MTTMLLPKFSIPNTPWWQYCKWAGWPILAIALLSGQPILWAIAAHWLVDFTFQSGVTACGKQQKKLRILLCHAFISGGFAGFIAGGLTGLVVSVVIHFLVDRFYKPVVGQSGTSHTVDQMIHILTIILIYAFI